MEPDDSRATSSVADGSSDASSEPETELMVTTRTRRTTAGNRYNNVVAQEQAAEDEQDDVALLFAEVEGEDEEYHSDEIADDADMSSSDDDDQGPNVAPDDLEGETEIQKEAKAERAKKRKADLALTSMSGIRKKPKIDPTTLTRLPTPKPSKRKERVSWLPDQGFAPGRTSLRKQTIAHRAETHAKLEKNEKQRLKAKAVRAQREKEREADAPKELTQADRLAEAERVERRNAKSLNRWEAMEKRRQEEQAARLAALKDRKLKGAVISSQSSRHVFQGWRNKDNPDGETGEVKKRGRKSKAYLEQLAATKLMQETSTISVDAALPGKLASQTDLPPVSSHTDASTVPLPPDEATLQPAIIDQDLPEITPKSGETLSEKKTEPLDASQMNTSEIPQIGESGESVVLQNSLPESGAMNQQSEDTKIEQKAVANEEDKARGETIVIESNLSHSQSPGHSIEHTEQRLPIVIQSNEKLPEKDSLGVVTVSAEDTSITDVPEDNVTKPHADSNPLSADPEPQSELSADLQATSAQPAPAPEVISTRNLVVLENFESLSSQARGDFNLFYTTRKTTSKPIKHTAELCLITGLPVRYRDPVTGMGYHNANAFKKLKELREHRFVWSSLLGCYTGSTNLVARGVPEGFTG